MKEEMMLRGLAAAGGMAFGVCLMAFDSFYEGLCPERYWSVASPFPQPFTFLALGIAVLILVGMVIRHKRG